MQIQNRQLAAILFTDIVGYTAIMQQDDQTAVLITKRYTSVLRQTVTAHGGIIHNDYGDGSLCTFGSATSAVQCAMEMQQQLQKEPVVPLRIGLHVGEIFFEDGKIFGDGVNVASRIQSLGIANSILFSSEINSQLKNQQEFKNISVGRFEFKNVDEPMEIFALANKGLIIPKREEMSGKLKELQKKSSRRNWRIAISFLVLLSTSFFVIKYYVSSADFKRNQSIAVLPFETVGPESGEYQLADNLTWGIIDNLQKISSLQKVIGWTSVKNFKGKNQDLKKIADQLGVSAILSGTVENQDHKTHIYAELIEISSNKRLGGVDLDYDGKDLVSIQSKVSEIIIDALRASLTPQEKKNLSKHYTENEEAYKFYLRGRNYWNAQSPENFDSAQVNYKRAIQLDPNYALAYAGVADCYAVNFKGLPQNEQVPIAKIYLEKALSLDSTLSEALTTLGFIQQNFDYDWSSAEKNLSKAILFNPNNAIAHSYYGLVLLQATPDKKRGLAELKKGVDLDPLSFWTNWLLARNYYFLGEYDKAIGQFKKLEAFAPARQKYLPVWSVGLIYLKQHLNKKAKEVFDSIPEGDGKQIDNFQVMQSYAYAIMGDKTKAKALLTETLDKYPQLSHYRNAQVYVALGNFEEAMSELELGYDNRDPHMFWIRLDPEFNPIRNDPRFKKLLTKMHLA